MRLILFVFISILLWCILPDYLILESDSGSYINPDNFLYRTCLYPTLIKGAGSYHMVTFIQSLLCAGIFYFMWLLTKNWWAMLALALTGAYIVYIPYIMTDLTFSFFIIGAYYFLKRNLYFHFLFLLLASLTRPSLTFFFIVEPLLVYFAYKDIRKAALSLVVMALILQVNPLINYIMEGKYVISTTLGINKDLLLAYPSKAEFFYKSTIGVLFPAHWNMLFETMGYYKRDIDYNGYHLNGSAWVMTVNILFYVFYSVLYVWWMVKTILKKNYINLLWVIYFVGISSLVFTQGPRMRLPFEFIFFIW